MMCECLKIHDLSRKPHPSQALQLHPVIVPYLGSLPLGKVNNIYQATSTSWTLERQPLTARRTLEL